MKYLLSTLLLLLCSSVWLSAQELNERYKPQEGARGAPAKETENKLLPLVSMQGRKLVSFPPDTFSGGDAANPLQTGKVAFRLWINREGEIIRYNIISASQKELALIAKERIKYVKFNKSEEAPQEQNGTLIFIFRVAKKEQK